MCITAGNVSFDDWPRLTSSFGWIGLLRADDAAGELDRAVGDHLVGVHVRLRAGTGLEHDERELRVERAVDHLLRGARDQLDLVGGKLAELAVGDRGRTSSGRRTRG